jgi:hypothetical protein
MKDSSEHLRSNRFAQGAGCFWLVFAFFLLSLAFIALGVSINGFPVVLPWLAVVLIMTLWLFARPTALLPSFLSLVASVISIWFFLGSIRRADAGSQDTALFFMAWLLPVAGLSVLSLLRLIRADERHYL